MMLRSERLYLGLRERQSDDETTIDVYMINHWGAAMWICLCFCRFYLECELGLFNIYYLKPQYIFEIVTFLGFRVFAKCYQY